MGIAQKVARNFSDAVRSRGQSYFVKGRVTVMAARPGEVVAKVRGTSKYRVRLRMRGSKLLASCTCPYFSPQGEPCKHLWATLLLAEARGLLQSPPGLSRSAGDGEPSALIDGRFTRDADRARGRARAATSQSRRIWGWGSSIWDRHGRSDHLHGDPRPRAKTGASVVTDRVILAVGASEVLHPATTAPATGGRSKTKTPGPGHARSRPGADQGRQSQCQAVARLCARRRRHARAEPGRHRSGPPPAQDDRRMGATAALVLRSARCSRQVRPRRPADPGSARRSSGHHGSGGVFYRRASNQAGNGAWAHERCRSTVAGRTPGRHLQLPRQRRELLPSARCVGCAGSCSARIRQPWSSGWRERAGSGFAAPRERKIRRRCAGTTVSPGGFRWKFAPS